MVVFVCDACQESVNRPKVEAHAMRCGGHTSRLTLSCVDCGQQFRGEEFRTHVKCVSEDEKYQGHLYKKSGKQTKKDTWSEVIYELQAKRSLSRDAQSVLDATLTRVDASHFPNKRPKFANFFNNGRVGSARYRDSVISEIWDELTAIKAKVSVPPAPPSSRQDEEDELVTREGKEANQTTPDVSRKSLKRKLKENLVSVEAEEIKLSTFSATHFPGVDKDLIANKIAEHYGEKYEVKKNEKGKRVIVRAGRG